MLNVQASSVFHSNLKFGVAPVPCRSLALFSPVEWQGERKSDAYRLWNSSESNISSASVYWFTSFNLQNIRWGFFPTVHYLHINELRAHTSCHLIPKLPACLLVYTILCEQHLNDINDDCWSDLPYVPTAEMVHFSCLFIACSVNIRCGISHANVLKASSVVFYSSLSICTSTFFFVSNAKISPVIKIRNVAHILVSCNISCVLSQKCARASSVFLEKRSSFFIRFINCWTGNNEISSNSTRNRLLFVFHLQSVRAGFTWFESN